MHKICLLCKKHNFNMRLVSKYKPMHKLAEIFKREKINGKSQKDAAKYLGIDYRSVSRHLKQKNIGLDVLYKYAEYLECRVEDFISVEVIRQINGYVYDNKINFYKDDEERPVLSGFFTAAWWWNDKKTVIIIDKNDPKGVYYNFLNFYSAWHNPTRIKDQLVGLYKPKNQDECNAGFVIRKSEKHFICRNFYDSYPKTHEISQVARFISSYNLNDLPLSLS